MLGLLCVCAARLSLPVPCLSPALAASLWLACGLWGGLLGWGQALQFPFTQAWWGISQGGDGSGRKASGGRWVGAGWAGEGGRESSEIEGGLCGGEEQMERLGAEEAAVEESLPGPPVRLYYHGVGARAGGLRPGAPLQPGEAPDGALPCPPRPSPQPRISVHKACSPGGRLWALGVMLVWATCGDEPASHGCPSLML